MALQRFGLGPARRGRIRLDSRGRERKLLVVDLGDAERHDAEPKAAGSHPNQRARRLDAKSAFSAAVSSEGATNTPVGLPGVE